MVFSVFYYIRYTLEAFNKNWHQAKNNSDTLVGLDNSRDAKTASKNTKITILNNRYTPPIRNKNMFF